MTVTAARPQDAVTSRTVRPRRDPVERNRRILLGVFVALCLVVALSFVWALHHDLHDNLTRRAFLYAAAFALIPVLPLSAFFIWLDRLRPEPKTLLVVALLWGALGAAYFSLRLNTWLAGEIGDIYGATPRSAVFVAPWVEETMKAAVVFAIVLWRRHDFNAVVAGVVYGGLVGIGFAFTENIIYYGGVFQAVIGSGAEQGDALDAVQELFRWRGLATPFVHPMFTMMTGLGIGLAVRARHVGVRILAPVAGFCLAVLLHMGFNGIVSFVGNGTLASVYVPILLPTLAAMVALVLVVRRHERQVLGARLQDYAAFGWLRPEHVEFIVTRTGRRRARAYARQFGKAERRRVKEFQRTGMDLGLLRDRMVRGVAGQSELPRERVLIQAMRDFRGRVMLPGVAETPLDHRAPASSSW